MYTGKLENFVAANFRESRIADIIASGYFCDAIGVSAKEE
jgi:hypothetical protein